MNATPSPKDEPADAGSLRRLVGHVRALKSRVYTCGGCGAWYCRIPTTSDLDKGDQCPKCGSSYFKTRDGRPFGPRSKQWPYLIEEFADMVRLDCFDDFDPIQNHAILK